MSVDILRLAAEDILDIDVQPQHYDSWRKTVAYLGTLQPYLENDYTVTVIDNETEEVLACLGIAEGDECGLAWSYLRRDLKKHMLAVTRISWHYCLEPYRLEKGQAFAEIDSQHPEAVRWAQILGFKPWGKDNWWVYE